MTQQIEENNTQAIEIKGGVIIQGSLFWEHENNCLPSDSKGKDRREWRENNLQIATAFLIPFPIRYGRSSSSRLCTYTMVASREYYEQNRNGQAKVAPFINSFNQTSLSALTSQIQDLAKVEGIWRQNRQRFANDWASIVIWINPNSDQQVASALNLHWDSIINSNGYDRNNLYTWGDGTLIDQDFKLDMDIEIGANEIDFLLMTYIQPKHKNLLLNSQSEYPNPEQIAQEMKTSGYTTYFCQNRFSGIVTSDDDEIIQHLTQ